MRVESKSRGRELLLTVSVVRLLTTRIPRQHTTQLRQLTTTMTTPEPIDPCSLTSCLHHSQCVNERGTARCQCPTMQCGDSTSDRRLPLCGSDDKDYDNECEMKSTSCREQRSITKKYNGFCGSLFCIQRGRYMICMIYYLLPTAY